MKLILGLTLTVLLLLNDVKGSTTSEEPETVATTATSAAPTTKSPEETCTLADSSCEDCVKLASCYYCMTSHKCTYYPYKHIFPRSADCDMGEIRWGVCWLNFKALVISMAVIGGVLVISITVCCCCCCRKKKKAGAIHENAKREREREERRIRQMDRQKERESKYDEIRRKYGLLEGLVKDDHPYQRFEA